MQGTEKLGMTGLAGLALVVLGILVALIGGFSMLVYLAVPAAFGVLFALIALCRGSQSLE